LYRIQGAHVDKPELTFCEKVRKLFAENKTAIDIYFTDGQILSVYAPPNDTCRVEVGRDYIALNPKSDRPAADECPNIIPFSAIKLLVVANG
jgi:hypothetical protein